METILGDIITWPWFSEPHGYNFNGHFIPDTDGNLCIDPVEPGAEVIEELVRRGVGKVLITNRNHVRAANRIRERTGARTYIHPQDAPHAIAQGAIIDGELRPGARVGPFQTVGAGGKSPGEVALYWPVRKILIVGDAVIGNPPGGLGLLPERVIDDVAQLRISVRSLLSLDFDILLAGDGVSIYQGAKDRLKELVERFPVQ